MTHTHVEYIIMSARGKNTTGKNILCLLSALLRRFYTTTGQPLYFFPSVLGLF